MSKYRLKEVQPPGEDFEDGLWEICYLRDDVMIETIAATESNDWALKILSAMRWQEDLENGTFKDKAVTFELVEIEDGEEK